MSSVSPARGVRVTVGICTYQRGELLRRLLLSLSRQEFKQTTKPEIGVLVVDNCPRFSASEIIEDVQTQIGVATFDYVLHGAVNIASGRNAVLSNVPATADYLALIDDDELPSATWLEELLLVASRTQAEIVCGPVIPVLREREPAWFRHDFYSVDGFEDGAELYEGITGNALLSRILLERGLRFDEGFGMSGGEDQVYFRLAHAAGAVIRWAARAVAFEEVEVNRLQRSYLLRRELRKGTTLGLIDKGRSKGLRRRSVRRSATAVKWMVIGAVLILRGAVGRGDGAVVVDGGMRMARGLGMVLGLCGVRYDLYLHREKTG